MKKVIQIKTDCNRMFNVDASEIAENRSRYYSERDDDTTYQEEYDYIINDDSEMIDWMQNNMDWYECKTLKEAPTITLELSDLEVENIEVLSE